MDYVITEYSFLFSMVQKFKNPAKKCKRLIVENKVVPFCMKHGVNIADHGIMHY